MQLFIKLNANTHAMIKNVKRVELNTKAAAAFLERGAFLIYTNLLTMTSISLFYYCEKVFTLINIWMIGKI